MVTRSRSPVREVFRAPREAGPGQPGARASGLQDAQSPLERAEKEQRAPSRWKAPQAGEGRFFFTKKRSKRSWRSRRIGQRTREKCARYRAKAATGVSEARSLGVVTRSIRARGVTRPHDESATTRQSDQARREACRSPVLVGSIPLGTRPTKSR